MEFQFCGVKANQFHRSIVQNVLVLYAWWSFCYVCSALCGHDGNEVYTFKWRWLIRWRQFDCPPITVFSTLVLFLPFRFSYSFTFRRRRSIHFHSINRHKRVYVQMYYSECITCHCEKLKRCSDGGRHKTLRMEDEQRLQRQQQHHRDIYTHIQ